MPFFGFRRAFGTLKYHEIIGLTLGTTLVTKVVPSDIEVADAPEYNANRPRIMSMKNLGNRLYAQTSWKIHL
jgi:hypothetical protein